MLRRHTIAVLGSAGLAVVVVAVSLLRVHDLGHWLQVHLGIVDEAGPYYGFWSGFGSDIAELSILGATGTAVYQLVKKFNCHSPGCWRVGNHPAAGGQFMLCYRHHPDYLGRRPTRELIDRLHHEHQVQRAAVRHWLSDMDASVSGRARPKPSQGPQGAARQ
jgi:hypothetical protein